MKTDIDHCLQQKNFWLQKMYETVDAIGVASFHMDTVKVDSLMFDMETYRICVEKLDRQLNFALTS